MKVKLGRPREFDVDTILNRSTVLFRKKGYHATSINDLVEDLALSSGSLYKAFDNKRQLFIEAFNYYVRHRHDQMMKAVNKGNNGYDRLHNLLMFYAGSVAGREGKIGCLVVSSLMELSNLDLGLQKMVIKVMDDNENLVRVLIVEGIEDGSINKTIEVESHTTMVLAFLQGIRVLGKTKISLENAQASAKGLLQIFKMPL